MKCLHRPLAAALLTAAVLPASAQDYPARPIRVIVPFAPGGQTDIVARAAIARLPEFLGQQVIVDNRGGGGTIVGTEIAARSAPDGYTIAMAVTAFAINASLYRKLPYDPLKDFTPITLVAKAPLVLAVHPSVPARTVGDLIALARKSPGKLNYGSPGSGTANHLTGELVRLAAKIDIVHVPYKGGGPGMVAAATGDVDMFVGVEAALTPHLKSGRLRAIGVTSRARSPSMPEVPTVAESGLPGFESTSFYSVIAPAGVPRPIVERLNRDIRRSVADSPAIRRVAQQGVHFETSTPDELGAFLKAQIERWAQAVKASGARAD